MISIWYTWYKFVHYIKFSIVIYLILLVTLILTLKLAKVPLYIKEKNLLFEYIQEKVEFYEG